MLDIVEARDWIGFTGWMDAVKYRTAARYHYTTTVYFALGLGTVHVPVCIVLANINQTITCHARSHSSGQTVFFASLETFYNVSILK